MRSDHPARKLPFEKATGRPRPACPLCGRPMPVADRDTALLPIHRTPGYLLCFREPITIAQAWELRRFRLRAHP